MVQEKTILIVEDDEDIIEALEKKLAENSYNILVARQKQDALKKIRNNKPNIVLLEITSGAVAGFDIMEQMRKEKLNNIPVIIISNSGQPYELEEAQRLGVRDKIIKTEFDLQNISDKIKSVIGK